LISNVQSGSSKGAETSVASIGGMKSGIRDRRAVATA
jgi:hypothetical protein